MCWRFYAFGNHLFINIYNQTMVTHPILLASVTCCFLMTNITFAMFFTNSKENDYPRIGKRPVPIVGPPVALLSKRHKTWERDTRFDAPEISQRMTDSIDDLLNFHGSEEWIVRREAPQGEFDYDEFLVDLWPNYKDTNRFRRNRNFDKKK